MFVLFLGLFISSLIGVSSSPESDLDLVISRTQNQILATISNRIPSVTKLALEYASSLREDGSWPDIAYNSTGRAVWDAYAHIGRLEDIVYLWGYSGQPYYKSTMLLNAARKALNFWLVHDFQNSNWWYNEIGVPLGIGQMAILLSESNLQSNQSAKIVEILARANWQGWTGANAVWMANVHVLSGSFTKNVTYVAEALEKMFSELVIMPGMADGIKVDGSFYQHGEQLYNGGYGADFIISILGNLLATANTSFYCNQQQLRAFEVLVLDGSQYMFVDSNPTIWDYSVTGRQITRKSAGSVTINPSYLAQVSSPRSSEFKNLASRIVTGKPLLIKSLHFWKSDYYVHRSEKFEATVKMYSTRMRNAECVNEEGKLSLHLSDGTTYLHVTSGDYVEIFPVWDWRKIPGITCEQNGQPLVCGTVTTFGKTTFVGGVSNGQYGVAAFDFKAPFKGTLTAHKSWYFFPDFIVAKGDDINCATSNEVVTSVNQCLLNGDVYASTSSNPIPIGTHQFLSSNLWVYHNLVGYFFPNVNGAPQSVTLRNDEQTGTWQSIGASTGSVKHNVFSLWINHKQNTEEVTQGGKYTYIAVPGLTLSEFKSMLPQIQSAEIYDGTTYQYTQFNSSGKQITGVTFWEEGSVRLSSFVVSISKPGLLLVVTSSSGIEISYSDPTQQLVGGVDLVLEGSLYHGASCSNDGKNTKISLKLPTGEMAGSTVTLSCTK